MELFYNRVSSHDYLNGLSLVEFEEEFEMIQVETAILRMKIMCSKLSYHFTSCKFFK